MKMKKLAVLTGVISFAVGAQAAIVPLTNASFEDPDLGSGGGTKVVGFDNVANDVVGWYDLGVNNDSGVQQGGNVPPVTGIQGAFFMGGDAGAGQDTGYTIGSTFGPGTEAFVISFYANWIWDATDLTVTLVDDAANVLGSFSPVISGGNTLYTSPAIDGYAFDGNLLSIQIANNSGGWISVDDVALEVIPEPATIGLVGIFGAGVLFVRRRFMI